MVGRSVGRRGVGRRRALSDGGRRTVGSFYSFLVIPVKKAPMETEIYNFLNSFGSYATQVHDELLSAKTGFILLSAVLQ